MIDKINKFNEAHPLPPTSGSNAAKPNLNYISSASVPKPIPIVYVMKFEDLNQWVETKAQIGDIAYCHDRISDRHYIYCYRKPSDKPIWNMINPDFLEKYSKKEDKRDDKMNVNEICPYETPCGWCAKWDKKCNKKIGCGSDKPQRGLRAKVGTFFEDVIDLELDDIRSGKGLSHLGTYKPDNI